MHRFPTAPASALTAILALAAPLRAQEPGQPPLSPRPEAAPPLPVEGIVEEAPADVEALGFGPRGEILYGGGPTGRLVAWSAESGRRRAATQVPGPVAGLGLAGPDDVTVLLADGGVWRWRPPAEPELLRPAGPTPPSAWGFGEDALALAFPDGSVETLGAGEGTFTVVIRAEAAPDRSPPVAALRPTADGLILVRRDGAVERRRGDRREALGRVEGKPLAPVLLPAAEDSPPALFVPTRDGVLWRLEPGRPADPLPSGLAPLNAVAADPEGGGLLLAAGDEPRLFRWSLPRESLLAPVLDAGFPPRALAVTPPGLLPARVAAAGDTVHLTRLPAALLSLRGSVLEERPEPVLSGAVSPDGACVAVGSSRGDVRVWDLRTGAALGAAHLGEAVVGLAFVSPRRLALVTREGRAQTYDLERDRLLPLTVPGAAPLTALAAGGGRLAAGDRDGWVHLLTADAAPIASWPAHDGPLERLVFSPGGDVLATAARGGLGLEFAAWDLPSEPTDLEPEFFVHLYEVDPPPPPLALAVDSRRLLTGYADGVVRCWPFEEEPASFGASGLGPVRALVFAADGRHAFAAGADGVLTRLDLDGDEPPVPLAHQPAAYVFAAPVPGGRFLVTAGRNGEARLLEAETGRVLHAFPGDGGEIVDLAADAAGRYLAAGAGDGWVRLWDLEDRRVLFLIEGHGGALARLAFQRDGRHLLTGGTDGQLRVWRTADGRCPRLVQLADGAIQALRLLPGDEEVITLAADGTVRRLEVEGATTALMARRIEARAAAFAPDGERLAAAEGKLLRVRRATALDGEVLAEWTVDSPIRALAWSDDGRWIAAGDEAGAVALIDPQDGARRELGRHAGPVRALRFAPDSRELASLGPRAVVRRWDVERGLAAGLLPGHPGGTRSVAYVGDGRIATGGRFGRVRLWSRADGRLEAELSGWDGPSWVFRTADGRLRRGTAGGVLRQVTARGTASLPTPIPPPAAGPPTLAVEPLPLRPDVNPRFGLRIVNTGAEPVLGLRVEGGPTSALEVVGPWIHARLEPGAEVSLPAYLWPGTDGLWPAIRVVDLFGRAVAVVPPADAFAPPEDDSGRSE